VDLDPKDLQETKDPPDLLVPKVQKVPSEIVLLVFLEPQDLQTQVQLALGVSVALVLTKVPKVLWDLLDLKVILVLRVIKVLKDFHVMVLSCYNSLM
jgi:hypothetical protein